MPTASSGVTDFERERRLADVTLRHGQLGPADLPQVCVKSGDPAERYLTVVATSRLGWRWCLVVLGVLPFLIVAALPRRSFQFVVPVSAVVARRIARIRVVMISCLLLALCLSVTAYELSSTVVLAVAVCSAVLAGGAWLAFDVSWVDATLQAETVELRRVHPDFARAVQRRAR